MYNFFKHKDTHIVIANMYLKGPLTTTNMNTEETWPWWRHQCSDGLLTKRHS